MTCTTICRRTSLALLLVLLAGVPWIGMLAKPIGSQAVNDWLHAFCLTQAVLLAACAVYGPGRFVVRIPLVIAWGLAIGFFLATLNLISSRGRASLAAGAILIVSGTLSPLIVFMLYRWRTKALVAFEKNVPNRLAVRSGFQFSFQLLLLLTGAFAATAVVARTAMTAPPDPFGTEHDILVVHVWLGLFPCLAAAPVLLVIFRPSWKILLAAAFFLLVTLADPILLGIAAPYVFKNQNLFRMTTWDVVREIGSESFWWHGQAVTAVIIYAVLARASGMRMVLRGQSNDNNPNPSAHPATEAGCVQD